MFILKRKGNNANEYFSPLRKIKKRLNITFVNDSICGTGKILTHFY